MTRTNITSKAASKGISLDGVKRKTVFDSVTSFFGNTTNKIIPFGQKEKNVKKRQKFLTHKKIETNYTRTNNKTANMNREPIYAPLGLKLSFALLVLAFLFVGFSVASVVYSSTKEVTKVVGNPEVAGVSEIVDDKDSQNEAFEQWISGYDIVDKGENLDEDGDGLTNIEEFLIGTNPVSMSTCGGDSNDAQKLIELIDPVTCREIDLDNKVIVEKYQNVVDLDKLKTKYFDEVILQEDATLSISQNPDGSLLDVFEVDTLEELDDVELDKEDIDLRIKKLREQQDKIDLIAKVDEYIKGSRSLEPFDREYEIPVGGAVYVDVAIRYDTPLKYVLAIAQRESRFGTDRYTNDGFLTRPGQYQNIYSIGLDDSGNNLGFETWEKGVEGFGKWYRRFDDAGVSDCRKWRIYNPNGDYCQRVNESVAEIEYFFGGPLEF